MANPFLNHAGRYEWNPPNTTTHECQHMDLGACRSCRNPMAGVYSGDNFALRPLGVLLNHRNELADPLPAMHMRGAA